MREFPRFAIGAAVEFHTSAGVTRGTTENVSRGGLAAIVEGSLPTGTRVMVKLSLVFDQDTFSESLELPALVVWCTAMGTQHQIGLKFMPLSSEQRTYLSMFLRYLQEGTASRDDDDDEDDGDAREDVGEDDSPDPFAS